MLIVSTTLTFVGLVGLGAAAALAYVLIPRRPPAARDRPRLGRPTGTNDAATAEGVQPPAAAPEPNRVSLRAVVDRMAAVGDDETTFLDRTSNRLVTLSDEALAVLEGDESFDDPGDLSHEELKDLRSKLTSRALLQLPTKADTNEFQLHERFCEELPEGEVKEQMLKVLLGQTGFRSFDGAVKRLGIAGDWQRLRDAEFAKTAIAWLERNGISFDRDVPIPDEPDQELRRAS
ncbi:MAG: hypothetical protein ACYS0G_00320 [Planctomycetota bacterium]|jgi:hypothetical protein